MKIISSYLIVPYNYVISFFSSKMTKLGIMLEVQACLLVRTNNK